MFSWMTKDFQIAMTISLMPTSCLTFVMSMPMAIRMVLSGYWYTADGMLFHLTLPEFLIY